MSRRSSWFDCFCRALAIWLVAAGSLSAQSPSRLFRTLRRIPAAEAHQAVAVNATHFFAITNRQIGKYDKSTGRSVAQWKTADDSPLRHLNSGVVLEGKLYCAHSDWPAKPTKNSIEIWDAAALQHIDRHAFTQYEGAVTWIDRHRDHWWVVFAHYGTEPDIARTTLYKLDDSWQRIGSWQFPAAVIKRFASMSNSGGSWGPDGLLYAAGHDHGELYALRVPASGTTLELVDTVPIENTGQGIAWDRHDLGVIYGIRRSDRQVVACRLSHSAEYNALQKPLTWRRDLRNPILPPGAAANFDAKRCMNPWIVRDADRYRLYYSGGDAGGRQRIGVATAAVDDIGTWQRGEPLFETGAAGAFDARWCVLPHMLPFAKDRWHLYYTGNAGQGSGLSAFPGIGVATSSDGRTWRKHAENPVLQRSDHAGDPDAVGIAGGSLIAVKRADGATQWRFYYTGCPTIGQPLPLNQQKTICYAVSDDGVHWKKRGAVMYRDPGRDYENIGVAGPVVVADDAVGYRMWYSAIGTRWGFYSICYAESGDGIHWRRGTKSDDNLQLTPQGDTWERQMVEYPSVIREGDHWRMFYCGNGYGQTGIGTARSVQR